MIDEPDDVLDYQVARHIVNVHQKRDQALHVPYSMTQIQRYIKFARSLKPRMRPDVRIGLPHLPAAGIAIHNVVHRKDSNDPHRPCPHFAATPYLGSILRAQHSMLPCKTM